MKVITKPKAIDTTLVKLMKKYERYHFATAWASLGSAASQELLKNKNRIKKMIVGTHFYQTNPDFINKFIDSGTVNFILNPDGIYHPKVYLFSNNENEWECIIGSANFTFSALSKNSEVVVHLKSEDDTSNNVYMSLIETVETYWEFAAPMSNEEYQNYKKIWNKNRKKINSLKGKYDQSKKSKLLVKSKIFTLTWDEYFARIKVDKFHSFTGRIELLNTVRKYFMENRHFSDMDRIQRREIAGIATNSQTLSNIDWGWFGSMKGAGKFQKRINENDTFISQALDEIPIQEDVYRENYYDFIELFQQAFPNGGAGIAIASRLLAMKRPDCFVCLDSRNAEKLCKEFGIAKPVSCEAYWEDIIERIHDSIWYLSPRPSDTTMAYAWSGRAAMLDSVFYEEKA